MSNKPKHLSPIKREDPFKQHAASRSRVSTKNNRIDDNDLNEPNLTFGIELEYIYVSYLGRTDDRDWPPMSAEDEAIEVVREALSGELKAKCRACNEFVRFKLPLNRADFTPRLEDNDFAVWDVVREHLLPSKQESKIIGLDEAGMQYTCAGVEIKSRILSPRRDLVISEPTSVSCTAHKISCEEEISAVMHALRKRFCTFSDRCRSDYLYANPQCGLHVHVGIPGNQFALPELRNVISMYIASERLIDEVCAPHRISWTDVSLRSLYDPERDDIEHSSDYDRDQDVYNISLAAPFMLEACRRRQQTGAPGTLIDKTRSACDIDAWVKLVQSAASIKDLKALYGNRLRTTVVNIMNVARPQVISAVKTTIEFRQAASSLQTEQILRWVDFVVKLVSYCRRSNPTSLDKMIGPKGSLRQPESRFTTLAAGIGCTEETISYYRKRLDQSGGEWARNVRSAEKAQAQAAREHEDLLADLALCSIEKERRDTDPRNVRERMHFKLVEGGYGQYPAPIAIGIASELGYQLRKEELERITIGYRPPFNTEDGESK